MAKNKKAEKKKESKKESKKDAVYTNVPSDKAFFMKDGRVINNLKEFAMALQDIHDDTFNHHVNAEKDDFSAWVRDVVNDKALADSISKKDKNQTYHEVLRHIIKKM